jgi:chromosome segregation ATPase
MVAASGQSPVYLMDEIDAALDEENQNRVAKLIHEDMVAKGIQVISVSHHIAFQRHCGKLIQVTRSGGTTRQQKSHESL